MLHLSVAQIAMAMQEGEDSVDTLSQPFTAMVTNVGAVADAAQALSVDAKQLPAATEMFETCATVQSGMHESIVAFQSCDLLSQRLTHVNQILSDAGSVGVRYETAF